MRLVDARPNLLWLCERAHCELTSRAMAVAAMDGSERIRGMVALDNVTRGSCEAHIAADTPAALRPLIYSAFRHAFDGLGLRVVVAIVPANNSPSLRLVRRLGFRETHRIRDGWDSGIDMVVNELRRQDCAPWLRNHERQAA